MAIERRHPPVHAQNCRGSLLNGGSLVVSRFSRLPIGISVHQGHSLLLYAVSHCGCITTTMQLRT